MSSINTNLSAMTALQALKSTQNAMNKNQNQISTGLRVSEASHNASYWSISTKMKSDNGALSSVKDSIKQSTAMINTYSSAMDKALTYLNKMKEGLVSATQPGADLEKIQTEFNAHISGLKGAAGAATFNGQNWLTGEGGLVKLVTSYDGNNQSVGTLAIDTSKTALFKDAVTGDGGILGDVAKINIDGKAAYVDIALDEDSITSITKGDKLAITVGTTALDALVVDNTNIKTVDDLVNRINGDSKLNQAVVASKTDDGKLRLTATDVTKTLDATYTEHAAGDITESTTHTTISSTLKAGNGATKGGTASISGLTAGTGEPLAAAIGDQIRFTLSDGTEQVLHLTSAAADVDDVAEFINDNESVNSMVTASVKDGNLVLQAKDPSKNFVSASYVDNYTLTATGTPTKTASKELFESTAADQLAAALKEVDEAINKVTEGSSMLGANKALLETQSEFIGVLSDSLTAGVSAFIDADMNEVSTRNQALQTQQQLGVQALSMANQNSQMILRLFQ